MKKALLILGVFLGLIIVALVAIPIIFKDDIKAAVDQAIGENLNARVYYDPNGFNLSLIPNFPNFTIGLKNFGIAGIGTFENDTLVSVASFEVVVDLMSIVTGDQITINAIILDQPNIMVLILPDGMANYDIAVASEVPDENDEPLGKDGEAAAFNIGIKKWEIKNANIVYYDESLNFFTTIANLNHLGSGDFTQDIFDLKTWTTIDAFSMEFEGENYLKNKPISIDITLSMDLPNAKYTFKENTIKVNDFGFGFDGYVAMPTDDIAMDLTIKGRQITIASILSLIPGAYQGYLDGLTTSGEINFEGNVKGIYNEQMLPDVNVKLGIANGKVLYQEYPIPIEAINLSTELIVPGDNMDNMTFEMDQFSMLIDGEKAEATMSFSNLQNYTWAFDMKGNIDLEKLMKIVPLGEMELKGKIKADFSTSGSMALIDAKQYDQIPAKGSLAIQDFYFESEDLPQGFAIHSSQMTFNPRQIQLKNFDAAIGKSDMQLNGSLSNFIGFAFNDKEVLKGDLNFWSKSFDTNEWMTEQEAEIVEQEDTLVLEVIRIPENIHFVLNAKMEKILYGEMTIADLDGRFTIKNGTARLDNVDFDLLGGMFIMNGLYNSVPTNPKYDFGFKIKELSIPASFETFNTIEKMAPVAENMTGNFSTDFKIKGVLGQDMMPVYEKMNGKGEVQIADASLNDKISKSVAKLLKSKGEGLALKDINVKVEIKNGRMFVEPFDVTMAGRTATVYGSNGIEGDMDYYVQSTIKTGAAGNAINSLLSSYTGGRNIVGESIDVTINVRGTYDDPKIGLGSARPSAKEASDNALKAAAKAAFEKQKKIAEEKIRAELEKQKKKAKAELEKQKKKAKVELEKKKKEVETKAKSEIEKQKKAAEAKAKAELEKQKKAAEKKAKDALKDLFGKKKGN